MQEKDVDRIKAIGFSRETQGTESAPPEVLVSNDMVYVGLPPRIFVPDRCPGNYRELFVGTFQPSGVQLWEGYLSVVDPEDETPEPLLLECLEGVVRFKETLYRSKAEVIQLVSIENQARFMQFFRGQ